MVNTKQTIIRERTRLRRSQNPQQIDFKKMRKAREARTKYWAIKTQARKVTVAVAEKTKAKEKGKAKVQDKPKKEKKPELEVIEEVPEIDEELEDIYSLDEEDLDDFEEDTE